MPMFVDTSRWPLVVCRGQGTITDEDMVQHRSRLDATIERKQTFAILLDARNMEGLTPTQRRQQAQWIKNNLMALGQYCAGVSFVMDRAIMRGVLTAILWIQPLPMPHTVFARYEEGESWIVDRLKAVGATVPGRRAAG